MEFHSVQQQVRKSERYITTLINSRKVVDTPHEENGKKCRRKGKYEGISKTYCSRSKRAIFCPFCCSRQNQRQHSAFELWSLPTRGSSFLSQMSSQPQAELWQRMLQARNLNDSNRYIFSGIWVKLATAVKAHARNMLKKCSMNEKQPQTYNTARTSS